MHAGDRVLALDAARPAPSTELCVGDLADDAEQGGLLVRPPARRRRSAGPARRSGVFCAGITSRMADFEMPGVFSASSSRPGGKLRLLVSAQEMPAMTRGLPSTRPRTNSGNVLGSRARVSTSTKATVAFLSASGRAPNTRSMRGRAQILELGDGLLRGRARGIRRGPDLGDQAIGAQVGEKAHPAFPLGTDARADATPRWPAMQKHGCSTTSRFGLVFFCRP